MKAALQLPTAKRPLQREFNQQAVEKLEKRYRKLAKELRRTKGSSNVADIHTLKEFLSLTMELIPIAKESYVQWRSDRSIYALNGLVNQAREIMNDLRQLRTGKKQHAHIINKIMLPNLTDLLQQYMHDMFELRNQIRKLPRRERDRLTNTINSMMAKQGGLFEEMSKKVQQALAEYLVS